MRRLNPTAEGYSEEVFVKDILAPHLIQFNVAVSVRKILTNRKLGKRGGIVSFPKFKNDVMQWIKEQPDAYHTSFIDLYGLKHDFPNCHKSLGQDPYQRVESIEEGVAQQINHRTFIAYIQLHEYESLLFSDAKEMLKWLSLYNTIIGNPFVQIKADAEDNPELIDNGPETAPSKRILSFCNDYDKVTDGIFILKEIDLETLRSQCRHFNKWITRLVELGRSSSLTTQDNSPRERSV